MFMTPIRQLVVEGLEIYTEDWMGRRELIATCPNETIHTWLVNCLVTYHKVNVVPWTEEENAQ